MGGFKLTLVHLEEIVRLLESKHTLYSSIRSKSFLDHLKVSSVVEITGRPKVVYVENKERLFNLIKQSGYKINTLEELKKYIKDKSKIQSRDEIVKTNDSTKSIQSKSFSGLSISVLKPLNVMLNSKEVIFPALEGTGIFIHESSTLELSKDIIVVGVENAQTAWYINRYSHIFDESQKYIFLVIKNINSSYERQWLESIENEYLHFGDYDLAGVSIYINEIIPRLKKCNKHSYLINDYIYAQIKDRGSRELFSKQIIKYKNLEYFSNARVSKLISFIKDNFIALEQESLANKK